MAKPLDTKPSEMSFQAFLDRFGGVYEHSPWIAEETFNKGIAVQDDDPTALAAKMAKIVEAASRERKLQLLNAHPQLVGKLAIEDKLTDDSKSEQSGAGLDKCSPEEFEKFQSLNSKYSSKFGFPFIIAVKGLNRRDILTAFEDRVSNDQSQEFQTALQQVHKIARLRIETILKEN